MGKLVIFLILVFSLLLPGSFAFAQTPTPSPTPTPTPTATPEDRGLSPVGSIILYGGSSAPSSGWLTCDGSAVSRTTYAHLFAIVGTTYGAGNGSTTFNLPDLRGRVPVGSGQGASLTNRTLGQAFGEENHTLTIAEMPAHSHAENGYQPGATTPNRSILGARTGSAVAGNVLTDNTGGDGAHNNMQPSAVVAYYIFAGEELDLSGGGVLEVATPDGATVYSTVVYGESSQTVAIHYEVTPGDMVISSLLFVLVGLILVQMFIETRRLRK